MARTSRQERRQRRAQAAGTPPLRPPVRPTANGGGEPRPEPQPAPEPRAEESRARLGFVGFIRETIGELKKVEWPGQQAVVSGTAVVLVACLLVGVFLYANDRVWAYFVQHVLLR